MLTNMHFAREDGPGERMIRAYEPGRITIGEQHYRHSLILTATQLIADWRPRLVTELLSDDFVPVLELQPEILLLGTGDRLDFPSAELTAALLQARIGVEVMDTAAACRTYNILLAEQRNVAAALLLG